MDRYWKIKREGPQLTCWFLQVFTLNKLGVAFWDDGVELDEFPPNFSSEVFIRMFIVSPGFFPFFPWFFPWFFSSGWWFGCHQFYFPRNIGNVIIPIDEVIFFRGVAQPPTSHCLTGILGYVGAVFRQTDTSHLFLAFL